MSKRAEQAGLIAYPVNNIKVHQGYNGDFVDYDKNNEKRKLFVEGYNQASKDLMEKAKQWFTEYTNIPYGVETNEDGEPLADSYIQYAKARLDAANEMFEKFEQFITEN